MAVIEKLAGIGVFIFLASSLLVGVSFADAPLDGTNPAQWRLVWTTDPATTATISWSTSEPGKTHRVHFKSADGGEQGVVGSHRDGRFLEGAEPELYYHHVKLSDLTPSTKYTIVLESDGQKSASLYFLTAPDGDVPVKLLFGGDSRSSRDSRRQINQMMAELLAEQPDILALAHGGDYIVSGASLPQWSDWMSDHELTTAEDGRLLPIIPARGNHDRGPLFNRVFDFPEDDTNYYAMDLTPAVRLLTLNTEISTAGDQAKWLEEELRTSQAKHRWLLAQYHRPAYPAVKSPSSARQDWVPLFETYGLDVACEADGHNIKRTPPIREEKIDESGVVYIGEGGLGVGQRTPKIDERWYLQAPGKSGKGHHVQLLTLSADEIHYQAILLGREIFDDAVLCRDQ